MTGKILIVDDTPTNRRVLGAILERDFYTIFEAENGVDAIKQAKENLPDLILMDVNMPEMNGIEACWALKSDPVTTNIPIIIITSSDDMEEKHRGLDAGAEDFLTKPIDQDVLFARVRNLMRVKSLIDELMLRNQTAEEIGFPNVPQTAELDRPTKLLIAASSQASAQRWKAELELQGDYQIAYALSEKEAMMRAEEQNYDALIVAEQISRGGVGLRLIANLRANWSHRDFTVLFVAQSGTRAGLRSLELGANDYMLEPFDPGELVTRLRTQSKRILFTKNLREELDKQLRLSVIDPLTELHNRRYFDDYMPKVLQRAERDEAESALMMLDLDHFKVVNDQYGHEFGDKVLVEFANRIKKNLRAADMIIRFGGEEFLIITPGVSRQEAERISERICELVSFTPFLTEDGQEVHITTSVGVTMVEPGENDIKTLLRRADEALYASKEKGRNQVNFAA